MPVDGSVDVPLYVASEVYAAHPDMDIGKTRQAIVSYFRRMEHILTKKTNVEETPLMNRLVRRIVAQYQNKT